ncbi:MAG: Gfo/Idh/MocA family oxidoreductase [Pirellulaceae bacterium]|nr:Gfo/Idh/MocA family oxidoreductase [Pirellulaceae bacterium]
MNRIWKVAGVNFDHFHMGDLLRMVFDHPQAEIVGVCDQQLDRMGDAIRNFDIGKDQVFTDVDACLETTRPDLVILCPATADHAEWVERVAPHQVHVLLEKPFAASIADADRIVEAMRSTGRQLAINWPLRWYASHVTCHRLITEDRIGDVQEVHYYDGNRGPLWHGADKIEHEPSAAEKDASWFYKHQSGGGSLLDYLGYGTTLGTWFQGNRKPLEVTCMTDRSAGLEVDEHSITIARYEHGLSKFETRWGTFTDPWTHQPQPKCGFVVKGSEGTISSYDMESQVRLQTRANPAGEDVSAEALVAPFSNPVEYFLHCLERESAIAGPLSADVSRIGQQIVDTAFQSAEHGRTLKLLNA